MIYFWKYSRLKTVFIINPYLLTYSMEQSPS